MSERYDLPRAVIIHQSRDKIELQDPDGKFGVVFEFDGAGDLLRVLANGSGLTHAGVPISREDSDRISRDGP